MVGCRVSAFWVLEKNVETKWKLGIKSVYTKEVEA